jgi:NTE family protein
VSELTLHPTHRRHARRGAGPLVAFVLQGGGALSAPQVGMLRALTEAGITPDLVIGSSAGALNAVAFAASPTIGGLDRLEEVWLRLSLRRVAQIRPRRVLRAVLGREDALLSPAPLAELLPGVVPPRLEDTATPAHVVATHQDSGQAVVLSRGDCVRVLLASAAIPGIYPSVYVEGACLVDGGIAADVPVLQAEALGARICYVLPSAISADADTPLRGPISMAYRALGHILDGGSRRDIAAARGTVHVMPAAVSSASNPFDFRATRRLIEDGHRQCRNWLAAHATSSLEQLVPA